jgi:hypothetical protein
MHPAFRGGYDNHRLNFSKLKIPSEYSYILWHINQSIMSTSTTELELTGSILKEETIKAILRDKFKQTSVLEVQDAYPGYYQMLEQANRPNFIYLLTRKKYRFETIKRLESLERPFPDSFHISTAQLKILNKTYPSVRLRDLETYDNLQKIIDFLGDHGVKLEKPFKIPKETIMIKTDKVFWLRQVEKGIYMDKLEKEIGYISLSKSLSWNKFESTTFMVKNNWLGKGFDAALGHFNRKDGIEDVVRVYTQNNSLELLKTIRDVYLRMI